MLSVFQEAGLWCRSFEELGNNFRVTLYAERVSEPQMPPWAQRLLEHIAREGGVRTSEAAEFWETSVRTARSRLKKLVENEDVMVVGTGASDPNRKYVLKK
jgi:predicted ArsR family transcriptional regulator